MKDKILILGHARHGKDTVAEFLAKNFRLKFTSSSEYANKYLIYPNLKDKYNYSSLEECFNDRVNRRSEWYDLISNYNKEDKTKLAKNILKTNNIYVGMRSEEEFLQCIRENIFNKIILVFNPNKPLESKDSLSIEIINFDIKYKDILTKYKFNYNNLIYIDNSTNLEDLEYQVIYKYKYIL